MEEEGVEGREEVKRDWKCEERRVCVCACVCICTVRERKGGAKQRGDFGLMEGERRTSDSDDGNGLCGYVSCWGFCECTGREKMSGVGMLNG